MEDCAVDDGSGGVSDDFDDGDSGHDNRQQHDDNSCSGNE